MIEAAVQNGDQRTGLITPQVNGQLIEGQRYQVSKIEIRARQQIVWEILTDYNRLPHVFAIMTKSKIQSQSDCIKVLAQQVQPLPPFPAVPYVVQVIETSGISLKWHGLTNYIKVNDGHFCLEPTFEGQETLATFALRIEAPMLIPEILIRHQLKTIMPRVLLTLKAHSEALAV